MEEHKPGETISVHEAPIREGYTFSYWKGSEYQPGDKYTVTEDHTFTAQWKKAGTSVVTEPSGNSDKSDSDSGSGNSGNSGNSNNKNNKHKAVSTGDNNYLGLCSGECRPTIIVLVQISVGKDNR